MYSYIFMYSPKKRYLVETKSSQKNKNTFSFPTAWEPSPNKPVPFLITLPMQFYYYIISNASLKGSQLSGLRYLKLNTESELPVYKILDLTLLLLLCPLGWEQTAAKSTCERGSVLFPVRVLKAVGDGSPCWRLRLGWGRDVHLCWLFLGLTLTLEKALTPSPHWLPHLSGETLTYFIGANYWLQASDWS